MIIITYTVQFNFPKLKHIADFKNYIQMSMIQEDKVCIYKDRFIVTSPLTRLH